MLVVVRLHGIGVEFSSAVSDKPLRDAEIGENLRPNGASDGCVLMIAGGPGNRPAFGVINGGDDVKFAFLRLR